MLYLRSTLTFLVLLVVVPGMEARAGQMFEWGFSGPQSVSTSLPSCRTFPIAVDNLTMHGIPPFYMVAFAVGGSPITSFIGTNPSNLTWTVRHPIGTRLLLGVVDSRGNSGGVDAPLYTVTAGATTQCIPPAVAAAPFNVTSNVTDVLMTCQSWGLTIRGGTPPYNLTLAALNAPEVTNVTLGPNDTVFNYINRAEPGTQMIASVSDLNGRWATGSPLIRTQGSSNVSCPGLASSGSSMPIAQSGNESHARNPPISHATIGVIAGATAGALLLFGLGTWAMRRRQRLRTRRSQGKRTDILLSPFETWPAGSQTAIPPSSSAAVFRNHASDQGPVMPITPTAKMRTSPTSIPASSSPFRTWPIDIQPPSHEPQPVSRTLPRKHSQANSLAPSANSRTSRTPSPTASPAVVVRELPPPYAPPRLHDYQV